MRRAFALFLLFLSAAPAYAAECDLAFPQRIENGRFAKVCGSDLYAQRFYLFLNTRPGEGVMRPEYGFSLEQYEYVLLSARETYLTRVPYLEL